MKLDDLDTILVALQSTITEIPDAWHDVDTLLNTSSTNHARTRDIFDNVRLTHYGITAAIRKLPAQASVFHAIYKNADFDTRIAQLQSQLQTIDPVKLADETILVICKRTMDTVLTTPDLIYEYLAAFQSLVFLSAVAHHELLFAYLRRPTAFEAKINKFVNIMRAVGEDTLGVFIPVLSTMKEMMRQSRPHMEEKIKEAEHTMSDLDRAFKLEDGLNSVSDLCKMVEMVAPLTQATLQNVMVSFDNDVTWLSETYDAGKKSA